MPLLVTDPRRCSVYRWYAPGGQLLYVGASLDPDRRWEQICTVEHWPRYAAARKVEWFDSVKLALDEERTAIKTEDPLLNLNGRMRGTRMRSEHWRELTLPDGTSVTFLRSPHAHRWLVDDDEILEFLEAIECGRKTGYFASNIGQPISYPYQATLPAA